MKTALPSPDLASLLDFPPAGVVVKQGLDRVEIRLIPAPWTTGWGLRLRSPDAPWYRRPGPLVFLALYAVSLAGLASTDLRFAEALGLLSAATLGLLLVGGMAWVALEILLALLSHVDRAIQAFRPRWILLTPQRFEVDLGGRVRAFSLDSVLSLRAAPWPPEERPSDTSPGELRVLTSEGAFSLLRGVPLADLGWLADALQLAINQKKSALLAAGHDLSRPPPEAEALQAVAAQASRQPGSDS